MYYLNKVKEERALFDEYCNNIHSNVYYKALYKVFNPLLYSKMSGKLEISIGEKRPNSFMSYLTSISHSFTVGLVFFNNEPQLLFKEWKTKASIAVINLSAITDLQIVSSIDEPNNIYRHNISFKYNNSFDYSIAVIVNKSSSN